MTWTRTVARGTTRLALATALCAPILVGCERGSEPASDSAADATTVDAGVDTTEDASRPLALGGPVTVPVGDAFAPGEVVRDHATGETATVSADGTVELPPHPNGVLLIEAADHEPTPFTWDNATVYFVMVDRFFNGDPDNDRSYGRAPDGADEIGTWHGGDWRGLREKLDYLEKLGVTALWITAPWEQVHGWTGGGSEGDFPHYAYHGYWALDFTVPDANLGTAADLRALVDGAHARGIRVVLDVAINHPGYPTAADITTYVPDVEVRDGWQDWTPGPGESWHDWNDRFMDYDDPEWTEWWGSRWIRIGLPGYPPAGEPPLRSSLAFLPDFITEDFRAVPGLPPFLERKSDTRARLVDGGTVRDHLTDWVADWVRRFGIDGFRGDTAKHVELGSWAMLHDKATAALREWKADNPEKALDDLEFWMTGEDFGRGLAPGGYYDEAGFDSMINFDFQAEVAGHLDDLSSIDATYATYAASINGDTDFNVLTFISSHDTHLFFERNGEDTSDQFAVGTALLMLPGGVQIFYGDETARPFGPTGSDPQQGTRSDMNWDDYDPDLLAHWRTLGTFRRRHAAIGAGAHAAIDFDGGYAFQRTTDDDAAVIVVLD
jgi:alpha-amylase